MVIAQSPETAREAAELIEVDFQELPAVIGLDAALAARACVHASIADNVCFDFGYGDAAKTAELIERAEHVVRVQMDSPRVAPNPMEPRAALAWYDPEKQTYAIRCAHQGAFAMRDALAAMLDVEAERIRVNLVDVGGAFGARTAPFSEYPLMLYMARQLGRPIKWLSTRSEDFLTDNHGRAIRLSGELAFDSRGRFRALRTRRLSVASRPVHELHEWAQHRRWRISRRSDLRPASLADDQHRADERLSRGGAAGGDLYRRAPRRRRRGGSRSRPARNPAPQYHPIRPDAVSHAHRQRIRQRRFCRPHRQGRGGVGLEEFYAAAKAGSPARRAARDRVRSVSRARRRRLEPER